MYYFGFERFTLSSSDHKFVMEEKHFSCEISMFFMKAGPGVIWYSLKGLSRTLEVAS